MIPVQRERERERERERDVRFVPAEHSVINLYDNTIDNLHHWLASTLDAICVRRKVLRIGDRTRGGY